jgi:hypothetical protein
VGYDSDRFAVEIARLALLLHAMPAGNSWAVQQRDVLVGGIPQDVRPGLILSNPPWKNTRSIAGHRHELADEFLRAALGSVRPGGFIGIILPAAWLAGATSRRSRRDLIERTRVFEVWRLPESTFGRSAFAPCVVFAQARASLSRRPYVFRRVLNRAESLARFRYEGVADESYLTEASLVGDSELLRGPLSEYRPEKPMRRLDDVAQVKAGPVPRPPVAERGKTGGNDLWLRNAGAILPFQEIPESAVTHIHYPQEFHRAAAVDPSMRLPKLFVSAKRSAENPWRLKIGLDLRGVIPRETLQIVIPKSGEVDDLYGLLAVLSTAFAACWIDQAAPKMVIEPRILGSVPLPSQDDWWRFPMLGRQLVEAATSGDGTLIDVLATIENAAAASYGLSQEEVDAVRRHMAGFIAPEGVPRFEWPAESLWNVSGSRSSASAGDRRTVGAVLQAGGSRLKLWLAGVTSEEGEWVQLPSQMPGWLCEPGRTLEAFLTDGDLSAARFAYQVGSYVDDPKDLFAVASSDVAWEQL